MLAVAGLGGAAALYVTQKPVSGLILGIILALAGGGLAALVFSVMALLRGLGWKGVRKERSFDLIMLLGTLILPLGAALIVKLMGRNPLEYQDNTALMIDGVVILILGLIAVFLGLWWNRRKWLLHAALFYIPYVLLYTTFFTNGQGLAVGFMGALGYWMEQQGVARGGQPLFYYAFIQIPVYEFLPAIGTLAALIIGITKRLWISSPGQPFVSAERPQLQVETAPDSPDHVEGDFEPVVESPYQPVPTLSLLLFWSAMTLIAFSVAGEKMPWLTIHIALPLCLSAGWAVGWLIDTIPWPKLAAWSWRNYSRAALLVFFGVLAVITARTAYRAAYINYDYAYEYMVYAHAARDPKTLLERIQDISERTTGGNNIVVAYDNNMRYPYWWYMRRYPNRIDFDKTPTSALRNAAVIIVSPENIGKVQSIVRDNYYSVPLMRLWWHNQDYWNLKWDAIDAERKGELGQDAAPMTYGEYYQYVWKHIRPFFTDPAVRHSIWEIWYNRDFTEYAKLRDSGSFTLTTWSPAETVTAYIRKDIANQVWNYGNTAVVQADPYTSAEVTLSPDLIYGGAGSEAGYFQAPRSLAAAPDGTIYVADSRNHRIQHLSADGSITLNTWGTFADISKGDAPGGTFNEPWGVAVGPDGSVYVADTWNHRIQKFSPQGEFITMWGKNGLPDTPDGFYGPRGIAVDAKGRVFVVDTGNNRVVIFDGNGNYISQFGVPGVNPGEFSEPVGIAIDTNGLVYITDTWNKRVQVFTPDATNTIYEPTYEFPVYAWEGQGIDNKPFIAVDSTQNVFVSDPGGCRILEFSSDGTIFRIWNSCDINSQTPGLPTGLLLDANGIWVTDAGENTLLHFKLTP
jgi:sugar lactone lactonase YvrE